MPEIGCSWTECGNHGVSTTGSKALQACARCKVAKYCSRDCQKADWPRHKLLCAALAAATPGRATPGAAGSASAAARRSILPVDGADAASSSSSAAAAAAAAVLAAEAPVVVESAPFIAPETKEGEPVPVGCPSLTQPRVDFAFIYAISNDDPVDLAESARSNRDPCRILCLGASDLASLSFTAWKNARGYSDTSTGSFSNMPLHAVLNDIEPLIVARHLLLLHILISEVQLTAAGRMTPQDAAFVWEITCNLVLTDASSRRLCQCLSNLCAQMNPEGEPFIGATWAASKTGRAGVACAGAAPAVANLLRFWLSTLSGSHIPASAPLRYMEVVRKAAGPRALPECTLLLQQRSTLWGDRCPEFERLYNQYSSEGYLFLAGGDVIDGKAARNVANPTFCEGGLTPYRLHYAIHPFGSMHHDWTYVADAAGFRFAADTKSIGNGFYEQFCLRNEALAGALQSASVGHRVTLFAGDCFRLCDLLQGRASWSLADADAWKSAQVQLQACSIPKFFDFVSTSNIADNTELLPLLLAAGPLLAADNPRAVLATDVMKGWHAKHDESIRLGLSGVPLWCLPYALGLQWDEQRLERSCVGHRDQLWSVHQPAGTIIGSLLAGAPGSLAPSGRRFIRWRQVGVADHVLLAQSPDLMEVIKQFATACCNAIPESCCGPPTFARFLQAMLQRVPDVSDYLKSITPTDLVPSSLFGLLQPSLRQCGLQVGNESQPTNLTEVVFSVDDRDGWPATCNADEWLSSLGCYYAIFIRKADDGQAYCAAVRGQLSSGELLAVVPQSWLNKSSDVTAVLVPFPYGRWGTTRAPLRYTCTQNSITDLESHLPACVGGVAAASNIAVRRWQKHSVAFEFTLSEAHLKRLEATPKTSVVPEVKHTLTQITLQYTDVCLAECRLPVAVDRSSIRCSVMPTRGTLELTLSPVPFASMPEAAVRGPLPRVMLATAGPAPCLTVNRAAKDINDSTSTINRAAPGRALPVWQRRMLQASGMAQLRESLPIVFHKMAESRVVCVLEKETETPVALLFLAASMHYSMGHTLATHAAVLIPNGTNEADMSRLRSGLRINYILAPPLEIEVWRSHYLPVACSLAERATGRRSGSCVCGHSSDHLPACATKLQHLQSWVAIDNNVRGAVTCKVPDYVMRWCSPAIVTLVFADETVSLVA